MKVGDPSAPQPPSSGRLSLARIRSRLPIPRIPRPRFGGAGGRPGALRRFAGGLGGGLRSALSRLVALPGWAGRRLAGNPKLSIGLGAVAILALVGTTIAYVGLTGSSGPTPAASQVALASPTLEPTLEPKDEPTPEPTPEPTASATPSPSAQGSASGSPAASGSGTRTAGPSPAASPTPGPEYNAAGTMVAATTDGEWLPASYANMATRKPIAVMLDDHWGARPQSGLSFANIVFHAPAEGGIPRYMALFQTYVPPAIGPIRSSREYFVAWAEEYKAIYVHIWGAPNAMWRLAKDDKKYIYNIDGLHWGGMSGYMWRVAFRRAPHNLYSSYYKLWTLGQRLGATAPQSQSLYTFADPLPAWQRGMSGWIQVPYRSNSVWYDYDHATNTYPRSVSTVTASSIRVPQVDAINQKRIAPSNVIVMYMTTGMLACNPGNCHKHRLDIDYTGYGNAMVFNNGQAIPAIWKKSNDRSNTRILYRSGPNAGQPIPMVRGQIFVQVVQTDLKVTWKTGQLPPPETDPLG